MDIMDIYAPNLFASLITFLTTLPPLCFVPFSFTLFQLETEESAMEGISATMRMGLKKFWRRKGHRWQSGSGRRKRNTVVLGATGPRRRWWRIKMSPKIRFSTIFSSPKKWAVWARDAYVRMMLGLANSRAMSVSASVTFYGGDPTGGFGRAPPLKEYDDKMIIHMYKSLVRAQGQLVPRDLASGIASETACQQ